MEMRRSTKDTTHVGVWQPHIPRVPRFDNPKGNVPNLPEHATPAYGCLWSLRQHQPIDGHCMIRNDGDRDHALLAAMINMLSNYFNNRRLGDPKLATFNSYFNRLFSSYDRIGATDSMSASRRFNHDEDSDVDTDSEELIDEKVVPTRHPVISSLDAPASDLEEESDIDIDLERPLDEEVSPVANVTKLMLDAPSFTSGAYLRGLC